MFFCKIIFILNFFGCSNQKKWKGVGNFEINRQESYNYSEMLSGDLDSVSKDNLEKFKSQSRKNNTKIDHDSLSDQVKKMTVAVINSITIFYNNLFNKKTSNTKFDNKILE